MSSLSAVESRAGRLVPDSDLERDCLFQLNAIVWATFPQPPGAPITPVLGQAGFEFWSMEQPLDATLPELPALRSSTPRVAPNPVADAVLYRASSGTYVFLEFKPTSFSPQSDRTPQVRGLIVAGGNAAGRLPSGPGKEAEVSCLVPGSQCRDMETTLQQLVQEVRDQSIGVCPAAAVGVAVKDDGVYLGSEDSPLDVRASMPRFLVPPRQLLTTEPGQSPQLLYQIPWIPNTPDVSSTLEFRERTRRSVISWLALAPSGGSASLSYEGLMDSVSNKLFSKWRDRASVKGQVYPELMRILQTIFGSDQRVKVLRSQILADIDTESDRAALMTRARKATFPPVLPQAVQLHLEDTDPES
jgi:hypothetical protein